MVDIGRLLQHMISHDVLRWHTMDDDRNWLVSTVTDCLCWVKVDVDRS